MHQMRPWMAPRRPGGATYSCPLCGVAFGGPEAFDLHRVADQHPSRRRCATVAELPALGLVRSEGDRWRMARHPQPAETCAT